MSVTPPSGQDPFPPVQPNFSEEEIQAGQAGITPVDSLNTSEYQPIVNILERINLAEQEFKQAIKDAIFADFAALSDLSEAVLNRIQNLANKLENLKQFINKWEQLVTRINSRVSHMNNFIADYNNGVNAGLSNQERTTLSTMRQAITDFENDELTPAQLIDIINDFENDLNGQFNDVPQSVIDDINLAIDQAQTEFSNDSTFDTTAFITAFDTFNTEATTLLLQEDQSQLDAMNAAIDQYNNDSNTTAFTTAAKDYNTYITGSTDGTGTFGRNGDFSQQDTDLNNQITSYNADIIAFNTDIDALNQEMSAANAGLGTIPNLTNLSAVTTLTFDSQTLPPGTPPIDNITNPNVIGDYSEVSLAPEAPELDSSNQATANIESTVDYQELIATVGQTAADEILDELLTIGNRSILLPESTIALKPEIFLKYLGAGSGPGIVTYALGLNSPNLEITLSNGLLKVISIKRNQPLSPRTIDEIELLSLQLFQNAALVGALPAFKTLSPRLAVLDENSPAYKTTIGLTIANQLLGLVKSDQIRSASEKLLANSLDPNLTEQQRNEFIDQITGAINLANLQFAISFLGNSTGLRGLLPQVYAIAGLSTNNILSVLNSGPKLNDVIENPLSLIFLKSNLSSSLGTDFNFTTKKANDIANSVVNSINGQGPFTNTGDLRQAFFQAFKEQPGITSVQAARLSNEAVSAVKGDLGQKFLNVAFDPNINPERLVSNLSELIPGVNASQVSDALNKTLSKGGFETQREFRNQFSKDLTGQGVSGPNARFLSNQAVNADVTGKVQSPLGINPSKLDALTSNLSAQYGTDSVQKALDLAKAQGPYSSQSEFLLGFKPALAQTTGASDAAQTVNQAIGSIANPSRGLIPGSQGDFLSRDELLEQIDSHIDDNVAPSAGKKLKEDLKNQAKGVVNGLTDMTEQSIKDLKIKEDRDLTNDRAESIRADIDYSAAHSHIINEVYNTEHSFIGSLSDGMGKKRNTFTRDLEI